MTEPSNNGAESDPVSGGVLSAVGWIAVGALSLAAVMYGLVTADILPFQTQLAVGLGLALGGGIGGVARLFTADSEVDVTDETMTVDVESTETAAPEPADLFDGHPDPVLFYAAEGHGPIVRAANDAYGETFDVPADRIEGTPLSEALLVAGEETVDADAVTAGGLDRIVDCETTDGTARFRLRTIENAGTGYLLYTPQN